VNCAALAPSLLESELFGHEKGSFTGATARRKGRFELASGGTLFLDEIGDISLELQAKLLRVLQEREFERVGGTKTLEADVRIIAATNKTLEESVANGEFREDLYFRLNVFPLHVPPLRERHTDVPLLVRHYVQRFNNEFGKSVTEIRPALMHKLEHHPWPGNVRELRNLIERAIIVSPGVQLVVEESLLKKEPLAKPAGPQTLEEVEIAHIRKILVSTQWRIEGVGGAAERLGINPSTPRSRLRKLGIERDE